MIFLGSKYGAHTRSAGLDCVGYFSQRCVPKQVNGRAAMVLRDPAPEILIGDPHVARAAIQAAPGKLKYRSFVLSFAACDIDVTEFNDGALAERLAVDHALRLFKEIAFAGIPQSSQPPIFVTTHTHVKRLELNILVPRWVIRADGLLRSFNPDPPGQASRAAFDTYEDLLNARFNWSDPRSSSHQALVGVPDWVLKVVAEARRNGELVDLERREQIAQQLGKAVITRQVQKREDVVNWLVHLGNQDGFIIHGMGSGHITVGPVDAPPQKRIRLRGLLFSQKFVSLNALRLARATERKHLQAERHLMLSTAPQRLQRAWENRARFNASRYGLDSWPPLQFEAAWFADGPLPARPQLMPTTRLLSSRIWKQRSNKDGSRQRSGRPCKFDPAGARTLTPRTGSARSPVATLADPRPNDRRPRSQGTRHRGSSHPLDGFTDRLAGPRGPAAILSSLVRRLRAALRKIVAQRAIYFVGCAIPEDLAASLKSCTNSLQKLNRTLERRTHVRYLAERNHNKTRPDFQCNPSASRTSSGLGETGSRLVRALGGDPERVSGCGNPNEGRRSGPDRSRGSGLYAPGTGDCLPNSGSTSESTGCPNFRDTKQLADNDAVVRCSVGSRAELIKHVLNLCDAADPGAPRSMRSLSKKQAGRVPDPLVIHIWAGPQDVWQLYASPDALDAVLRCPDIGMKVEVPDGNFECDGHSPNPF